MSLEEEIIHIPKDIPRLNTTETSQKIFNNSLDQNKLFQLVKLS